MQVAERWLGIGSVLVAVALAGFALRPHRHHHHHHLQQLPVDFDRSNCSGPATVTVTPVVEVPVDPYTAVFTSAALAPCFQKDASDVDMLVKIASDGHVISATHRPEAPTAASRCIASELAHLRFPADRTPLAIRYTFKAP